MGTTAIAFVSVNPECSNTANIENHVEVITQMTSRGFFW